MSMNNTTNDTSKQGGNNAKSKAELFIEPEYIIVNLIEADKKKYLPVSRLLRFVAYLRQQLSVEFSELLNTNEVVFNISFDSIERTVRYHDKVFDLIGDTIYVKNDNLPEVPLTQKEFLAKIADEFVKKFAA